MKTAITQDERNRLIELKRYADDEGEAAIASGDAVRMIQAYKALEGCA